MLGLQSVHAGTVHTLSLTDTISCSVTCLCKSMSCVILYCPVISPYIITCQSSFLLILFVLPASSISRLPPPPPHLPHPPPSSSSSNSPPSSTPSSPNSSILSHSLTDPQLAASGAPQARVLVPHTARLYDHGQQGKSTRRLPGENRVARYTVLYSSMLVKLYI